MTDWRRRARVAVALIAALGVLSGCGESDPERERAFGALDECIESAETDAQLDRCMRWTE